MRNINHFTINFTRAQGNLATLTDVANSITATAQQ